MLFKIALGPFQFRILGNILRRSMWLLYSHKLTLVLVSSLLLAFRWNVQRACHDYLSSLLDTDPYLKSFVDFSSALLLHKDDFYFDFQEQSRKPTSRPNATLLHLSDDLWFSNPVRAGLVGFNVMKKNDPPPAQVVEVAYHAVVVSAGFWYGACACMVLAVTAAYACVKGIVFVLVVNSLAGNSSSGRSLVWDGSNVGLNRLWGCEVMRASVRCVVAHAWGILFFGKSIEDHQQQKMAIFMPFTEPNECVVAWLLSDLILGSVFAVDPWVAVVEEEYSRMRRRSRSRRRRITRLLLALFFPAIVIRWLEAIFCGSVGKWVFTRVFGHIFTSFFQSLMEVYFMVAWLLFYFAARHMDDTRTKISTPQLKDLLHFLNLHRIS